MWQAQTALHRTPTPSRSLFSLLDQSRSAAGGLGGEDYPPTIMDMEHGPLENGFLY